MKTYSRSLLIVYFLLLGVLTKGDLHPPLPQEVNSSVPILYVSPTTSRVNPETIEWGNFTSTSTLMASAKPTNLVLYPNQETILPTAVSDDVIITSLTTTTDNLLLPLPMTSSSYPFLYISETNKVIFSPTSTATATSFTHTSSSLRPVSMTSHVLPLLPYPSTFSPSEMGDYVTSSYLEQLQDASLLYPLYTTSTPTFATQPTTTMPVIESSQLQDASMFFTPTQPTRVIPVLEPSFVDESLLPSSVFLGTITHKMMISDTLESSPTTVQFSVERSRDVIIIPSPTAVLVDLDPTQMLTNEGILSSLSQSLLVPIETVPLTHPFSSLSLVRHSQLSQVSPTHSTEDLLLPLSMSIAPVFKSEVTATISRQPQSSTGYSSSQFSTHSFQTDQETYLPVPTTVHPLVSPSKMVELTSIPLNMQSTSGFDDDRIFPASSSDFNETSTSVIRTDLRTAIFPSATFSILPTSVSSTDTEDDIFRTSSTYFESTTRVRTDSNELIVPSSTLLVTSPSPVPSTMDLDNDTLQATSSEFASTNITRTALASDNIVPTSSFSVVYSPSSGDVETTHNSTVETLTSTEEFMFLSSQPPIQPSPTHTSHFEQSTEKPPTSLHRTSSLPQITPTTSAVYVATSSLMSSVSSMDVRPTPNVTFSASQALSGPTPHTAFSASRASLTLSGDPFSVSLSSSSIYSTAGLSSISQTTDTLPVVAVTTNPPNISVSAKDIPSQLLDTTSVPSSTVQATSLSFKQITSSVQFTSSTTKGMTSSRTEQITSSTSEGMTSSNFPSSSPKPITSFMSTPSQTMSVLTNSLQTSITSSSVYVIPPTPSQCSPFDGTEPSSDSLVNIILAVPPSELDKLRIRGSLERCRLVRDIANVYKIGASKVREIANIRRRKEIANVRRRNGDDAGKDDIEFADNVLEEKQHFPQHKRQLMEEVDYTAVVRLMGY